MNNFDFETEYNKTINGERFVEEKIESAKGNRAYFMSKRIFDIVVSIIGIILSIIPSIIIAVLIKLTSKGPVFFLQDRLGQYGKPYKIIKFRTMRADAEDEAGPVWAEKDDPRVTKFGGILRKTHLDELPQFINVLKGEMSMVGPRPEREYFYKEFSSFIDGFDQRMLVPQGITGFAQISGGYDLRPEKKIIYDLEYIKHPCLLWDIKILFKTIF